MSSVDTSREAKTYHFTMDPSDKDDMETLAQFKKNVKGLGIVKCRGRGFKNEDCHQKHRELLQQEKERRGYPYYVDIPLNLAAHWDVYLYPHDRLIRFRMRTLEEFAAYYDKDSFQAQLDMIKDKGYLDAYPEDENGMSQKDVNRLALALIHKYEDSTVLVTCHESWETFEAWYFTVHDEIGLRMLLSGLMYIELGSNEIYTRVSA